MPDLTIAIKLVSWDLLDPKCFLSAGSLRINNTKFEAAGQPCPWGRCNSPACSPFLSSPAGLQDTLQPVF